MTTAVVVQLKREFRCGSTKFPDPGLSLTPQQVKELYEDSYPYLQNFQIEGPKIEKDVAVWELVNAVETKG